MENLIVIPTQLEYGGIFPTPPAEGPLPVLCGAGLVGAASQVALLLARRKPSMLLLLGVCGAYPSSRLNIGDVVRVDRSLLADFGAWERDSSWIPAESIGLGPSAWESSSPLLLPASHPWRAPLLSLPGATSASVQSACGTDAQAELRVQHSHAAIEEMEGAAVCAMAHAFGIPCYQVRAVSNRAGLRDRSAWCIDEALAALRRWVHGF